MACQTALDVKSLMAASEENTSAIHALCQEMARCTELKAVVDDLKTRQLNNIRENVKRVEATCSAAVSDAYNALDTKFTEGLDMVNIRVNDLLRAKVSTPPLDSDTTI